MRCYLISLIHLTVLLPSTVSATISDAVRSRLKEITCLGGPSQPLPSQPVSSLPTYDPNTRTLQSLCAQPPNGGGPLNIGGFCNNAPSPTEPDISGSIVFTMHLISPKPPTPDSFSFLRLQVHRLRAECLLRCFCTYANSTVGSNVVAVPRNLQPQPKYRAHDDSFLSRYPMRPTIPSQQTSQLTVDQHDDYPDPNQPWETFNTQLQGKPGTYGELEVSFMRINVWIIAYGGMAGFSRVSVDQINYIECEGPMPTFPLPLPWTMAEFNAHNMRAPNAITALCAIYSSGGYYSANAGGYCYHGTYGTEVWFADEMTPQYNWTWIGNNFFAAAAIRFHCWRYCRCKFPVKGELSNGTTVRPSSLQPMWELLNDGAVTFELGQEADGSLKYKSQSADGKSHSGQVLPPQTGQGSSAGTCGEDGRQFCPTQWPSELVGEVPLAPPEIPYKESDTGSSSVDRCGSSLTCHSPAGCGVDNDSTCKCVVPDAETAKKFGLDLLFPAALCLTIASWLLIPSSGGGWKRSLKPQLTLNGEGRAWRCLCNETYVSAACCTVQDGMAQQEVGAVLTRLSM